MFFIDYGFARSLNVVSFLVSSVASRGSSRLFYPVVSLLSCCSCSSRGASRPSVSFNRLVLLVRFVLLICVSRGRRRPSVSSYRLVRGVLLARLVFFHSSYRLADM